MAMRASGTQRGELVAHRVDGVDVVVQEVDLPAALELAQARFAHDARGVLRDEGLDGEAPLGRGGDHREIAQSLERHRQRARDRRRGERQHVDLGAQPPQLLLLAHAEAVLLVDDHEPEALELDVGLDELVRADHEVDRAVGEAFERDLGFLARAKARELRDLHRQLGEAVREDLQMLLGEQRRRHQHRDLLAVGDGDERRAQRHLGLAEAHVAADQPVHRLARRQVRDHRLDRRRLVGRFLEAEALGERLVVVDVELEGVPFARGALRVEVEQLGRGVVRALRGALLGLFPLAAAELVQGSRFRRRTAVAADQVQARHRNVELRVVGVEQVQELVRAFAEIERGQPEVAPDAVLLVHHRIADAHFREIAQHRVDVAAPRLALADAVRRGRVELGLGDHRDVGGGPRESAVRRSHRERGTRVAGDEFLPAVDHRRLEPVLGEVLLHGFAPSQALGDDEHALARRGHVALERAQRVVGATIDLHRRQRLGARLLARRIGRGRAFQRPRRVFHFDARVRLERRMESILRQEDLARRQQRTRLVAAQKAIARFGVLPEAVDRGRDVAVQAHRRGRRQVVEQRRGRVEKKRQVVLDAAGRDAVGNVLVQRRLQRVALEDFAESPAEARARGLVERELARRQQTDARHRIHGALRVDVEGAYRLDVVVEKVDAVGQRAAHREEVDQAAADAVFAGRDDLRDVRVAGERELPAQRVDVERLALRQEKGVRREIGRRSEAIQRGGGGDQQHVALAARGDVESREALGHQVLVRREVVVGQRLPVGQHGDAQRRREPRHLRGDALHRQRVGADHGDELMARRGLGGALRQRQRVRGADERRPRDFSTRGRKRRKQAGKRRRYVAGNAGKHGSRALWRCRKR